MVMDGRDGYVNVMDIFNALEVHFKMIKVVNCMLCVFYNTFLKAENKSSQDQPWRRVWREGYPDGNKRQLAVLRWKKLRDRGTSTQQRWASAHWGGIREASGSWSPQSP